ncbi:MAG: efflux RND transporter permease subunit [Candidatus Sumerlaeia bacterium]
MRVVDRFLESNLSIIFIVVAMLAGLVALWVTPREEDPQIVVPLADVFVHVPGAGAEEVEQQVTSRLEKILWEIDGVEYVYSMSRQDMAIVTVRFFVGEDRIESLVKLHNRIQQNIDRVPGNVAGWVVKPVEVDDVPILFLTLWSDEADDYTLRRVAEELQFRLQSVPNTAQSSIVGGLRRELHIYMDPELMAGYRLSPAALERALRGANVELPAGAFEAGNEEFTVRAGEFLRNAAELGDLIVGVHDRKPIYLRDVARVVDGPEEVNNYVRVAFGPAAERKGLELPAGGGQGLYPAVTLAFAKRKGTNAVLVAEGLIERIEELKSDVIPDNIHYLVTRNYGESANEKVNELVRELVVAIIMVILIIYLALGWREGFIVVVAVPIAFALTLFINFLAGYSINRVTLFALILTLGLVVDDPIVDVENIYRHFKMRLRPPRESVLAAVNEVRPPIIIATLAVIISFMPMFFITGMMGPYMRPMALNVPIAMVMSIVVSFTITPWMAWHMMRKLYDKGGGAGHGDDGGHDGHGGDVRSGALYRLYSAVMRPLIENRGLAAAFLLLIVGLLAGSMTLVVTGLVPVKMLPFDNKNEFQIVVNMPEGTTLEETKGVCDAFVDYLRTVPEVTDVEQYVGLASPMDFNGMVRHYYLRRGSNVADLRVNLADKTERRHQNHAIVLRLRRDLAKIAQDHGARIQVVEVPPGPPVFSTLVAEIYGEPWHTYEDLAHGAQLVQARMEMEPNVVDVDTTVEADQTEWRFIVDKNKAMLNGITTADVVELLRAALDGVEAGSVRVASDRNPLTIRLRVAREQRSNVEELKKLYVTSPGGRPVQLGEIGEFRRSRIDKTIYHKNLQRVAYAYGETAGRSPVNAILSLISHYKHNPLPDGLRIEWAGEGEWDITLRVFRDLGLAFFGALIGIYILLVMETHSWLLPLVIMLAIPLTAIGIMPGFWLLNALSATQYGGYTYSVYFTATAMIGMIALAGIVVRNSIILLEFIFHNILQGRDLKEAVIASGAVRIRPILLTSGAALLGNVVITLDPIFNGLGWAIVFGVFASTLFSLFVVPLVYYLLYRRRLAPPHVLAKMQPHA